MAVVTERKRASLHTLGCRLNQSETQILEEQLREAGFDIVPFGEDADLGVINTCTVTREADAKCRQAIRGFVRRNPDAFTAVVGCYSQMGAGVIASIEGVDLIIGNQDKMELLNHVGFGKSEKPVILRDRIDPEDFSINFVGDLPHNKRANLKIQDGCDFMCDFCIIPRARGRARSRDFSNIISEAETLAANGVKEVVLTGVNVGTFHSQEKSLVELIDQLDAIDGICRIRISSIEPTTVDMEIFDRMSDYSHSLLPFLHLPLQSGSDKVLEWMRRKYKKAEYLDFIEEAHAQVPDMCLGTDIMVGHPGEGEAEFEETCNLFLDNNFAYCHVFPFSERDGTLALKRSEQVPVEERYRRSAYLRRLSSQKRFDFYERYLGDEFDVLFENQRDGRWPGYTGNFIRVLCTHEEDLANRVGRVRLDKISADFVEATVLSLQD